MFRCDIGRAGSDVAASASSAGGSTIVGVAKGASAVEGGRGVASSGRVSSTVETGPGIDADNGGLANKSMLLLLRASGGGEATALAVLTALRMAAPNTPKGEGDRRLDI